MAVLGDLPVHINCGEPLGPHWDVREQVPKEAYSSEMLRQKFKPLINPGLKTVFLSVAAA